ncbi:ABC transporter permease [Acidiphilium sp. AL]|uniref:ABC transporter permease n=1 Tax=Acidiphilium iwatense TaxID=768198 RepID=A0ABS9DRU0_9PROT|nr:MULTISPECIES: ABC transporter permease [Acidiphilium]MCF3945397.1 ABC transporter permease [Acidiphilium iwatense]MCU4158913.1 ABC transporter permease [Acidiphilium sp. AL]
MSDLPATERAIRASETQPLFTLSADRGWIQRFQLAGTDLRGGVKLWRLAWSLAFSDIRLRYRGSALGPFWLTLSTAIMIGAMAFLYADLFHTDIHTYLPYLTVSIILWNYLNMLVSDGCTCFSQVESMIRGIRMPFTVHAARSVIRNTIILAHNIIVVVAVFAIMGVSMSLYSLWAIPGFLLWLIDAFAMSILFGAFCARFRDVPQIIMSVMQIAFFVTPIMWYASLLEKHPEGELLIRFNPFYYLLEIVRGPLLGTPMTLDMVWKALIVSGVLILVATVGFARTRGRIAYWV